MPVGVLALQGCIQPHLDLFQKLGVKARPIRFAEQLEQIERLIIPGGESTTMLRLLERRGFLDHIREFGKCRAVWGICAGAILLAKKVLNPESLALGLMGIQATRNYYGCQLNSFKAEVALSFLNVTAEVDFIRAPLLEPLRPEVRILANYNSQAVLLQERKLLASSFHIELGGRTELHEYFLEL